MENNNLAKEIFETLCNILDGFKWKYHRNDENNTIVFGVTGNDLLMQMIMSIDADRSLVRFASEIPFSVEEDKRIDMAIAVNMVNYTLAVGSFDFDIGEGIIRYRLVSSFKGSLIGKELVEELVNACCVIVDFYNDKFESLSNGKISLAEFITSVT